MFPSSLFGFYALSLVFSSHVSALASRQLICSLNATTFDFIVIGGGTAGLAVAARLSQRAPDDCILVVEAGPFAPDELKINIPGLKGSTLGGPYDWNFTSVPQESIGGRSIPANRGKVLGGTSAINLMCWDRGSVPDYDAWEELGNPGWNWDSMITAMEKVENFTRSNGTYGTEGVGYGGPIQTVVNRYRPPHQDLFLPTMENLGINSNLNSLGGNPLGVELQPTNVRPTDYTRSYSTQYLTVAGSNLHVLDRTMVSKINFEKKDGMLVATGVEIGNRTISASKEVILSAGVIQSPGILELSGIGQRDVLSSLGIETLVDLPGVGENYQDHIRIQNSYQLKPGRISFDELKINTSYAAEQMALYQASERSAYDYSASSYTYATWVQAFGNETANILVGLAKQAADSNNVVDQKKLSFLTNSTLRQQVPELELLFSDGQFGGKGYPSNGSALYGENFFTIIAGIMHPLSRGSVHVNWTDVNAKPVIDPHYFSTEYEMQALIAAAKYVRRIAMTPPLSDVWVDEYLPGLNTTTDDEWRAYVMSDASTIYHPLGTCAMLPKEDGGVVDSELRVYGVSNLRIVDASAIPIQPSGHPQTAIYGLAERAAEMIATEWGESWLTEMND